MESLSQSLWDLLSPSLTTQLIVVQSLDRWGFRGWWAVPTLQISFRICFIDRPLEFDRRLSH